MHRVESDFTVIGLTGRFRNDDPASIGAFWGLFHSSDVRGRVGDGASAEIYCVYHDYEGGVMDPYRMTIGYRVPAGTAVGEGLASVAIPAQKIIAHDARGPQPMSVVKQWQAIWGGDLKRAFAADYDIHDADDPEAVSVMVGVVE